MGRAPKYSPARAFRFSPEEVARYKEITAEVAAKAEGKSADPKAAAERIEAALASAAQDASAGDDVDEIKTSDADFVGIVLCAEAVSGGELKVDLDDVYVEEPREVAEDEEGEDEEERSLWGDGDDDPAEAGED